MNESGVRDGVSPIAAHLRRFCRAFDEHDWDALAACLTDPVYTDYSSFRAELPAWVRAPEYADKRRLALSHLETTHQLLDPTISFEDEGRSTARVDCSFAIHRRARDERDPRTFDSFGTYSFGLVREADGWKIRRIVQNVTKNEGDPSLHGAPLRSRGAAPGS